MSNRATREEYPPECTHELVYIEECGKEFVVFVWDSVNDKVWCNDIWCWTGGSLEKNSSLRSLIKRPLPSIILENE